MTDATPMLDDVRRQPEVVEALAARAAEFVALGHDLLRPGAGGRILAAGCGDGFFAAEATSGFATSLGLDWRATTALDLRLGAASLRPEDRVVCMSMSGNVDRTVEAAQAVAAAGVPLLALVNSDGGRLGRIAASKISLELPDIAPFLCGTASYTATVLALGLLAGGAAGQGADAVNAQALSSAVAGALAAAADADRVMIDGITGVRLLSAGADRGTVAYGAAKFVELTRIPAWSADLEEFAHSQYWSMPATDLVIVVATEPALAEYATASCEALAKLGVRTCAIDTAGAAVSSASVRITVPEAPAGLQPIVNAVPLQLVAYHAALRTGLDPNRRQHLKADETRFTVSRMLTRRSLIGTGQ